jgi:hypothetical protein
MLQKIGLKFRLLLLFVILLYAGCTEVDPINTKRDIKHTIIVYMAADNNLTGYVADNIDKMRVAMNNELSKENTIVAYVDQLNKKPCLLEIYNQKIDTIRVYDEMNSTDSEVLESIIGEVIDKYPSPSYGLIMWSHGSGWLNQKSLSYISYNIFGAPLRDGSVREASTVNYPISDWIRDPYREIETKAFGYEQKEGATWMELSDMADALPDNRFDYILFDACSMANIEVAYALRNKSDYLIGSALEILADGFPYGNIIKPLCEGEYSLVCQFFYDEYNQYSGAEQTAGVALINNVEIDSLANCFKKIVTEYADALPNVDISQIQRLDRYNRTVSFDMMDYVTELIQEENELLTEFAAQFNRAVPYSISTPRYLNIFDVNAYSGLSMYVPLPQYKSVVTPYFLETEWSRFTNFGEQLN